MTDLFDLVFELFDEPKGVSLGILFLGTHCVGHVIVVMSHEPHPIMCPQLVSLIRIRSESLYLLRDLNGKDLPFRHRW